MNREHRLVVVCESLAQHADLVDGFSRWRLRLSGGCLVVSRAKPASAFSATSPLSAAVPSPGGLLLTGGFGLAVLLIAKALDVPRDEAVAAHGGFEARIVVMHALGNGVEAGLAPVVLDASDRFVLDLRALDLRTRHRGALELRPR